MKKIHRSSAVENAPNPSVMDESTKKSTKRIVDILFCKKPKFICPCTQLLLLEAKGEPANFIGYNCNVQQLFPLIMTELERRNLLDVGSISMLKVPEYTNSSPSTEAPASPRYHEVSRNNKQKLELCKKFTEFGSCPYGGRCKFAHGYHELRKNNTSNCRYKTKQCVTYVKNCQCHYGDRCNFIHPRPQDNRNVLPWAYAQLAQSSAGRSRLLSLLGL